MFCKGYFPDSIEAAERASEGENTDAAGQTAVPAGIRYAFVSLDPDLYLPVLNGLQYFYPRMSPGGVILIHDYNSRQFPGAGRAVREYCTAHEIYPIPLMDMHGSAVIVHP